MNKPVFLFVLLVLLLTASVAVAQNPPVLAPLPTSNLEKFATRKDAIITTESYYVLRLSGDSGCRIRLQALIVYEEGRESLQVRGMKVDLSDGKAGKDEHTATAFVDAQELDGLMRSITSMLESGTKQAALPNLVSREISFSTVGGLTLSMVQRDTGSRQLLVTHALQPETVCTISQSSTVIELRTAIEQVLQSLK
jgi:hypothetical protein